MKGKPFKSDGADLTVGEAISNILSYDKTAGKFKVYALAKKFMDQDTVDLDKADISLIKTAIEKTETYIHNAITGGLIEFLTETKD